MFEADDVGFAIYREDVGYKYSTDVSPPVLEIELTIQPDRDPSKMTVEVSAMSQYAIHNHAEVNVIGDLNRDWRTRNNPLHKNGKGMRVSKYCHTETDNSLWLLFLYFTYALIHPSHSAV